MYDTLNTTKRGRDSDAYYRSHHGIYTVTGHSLGGAVALSLETQYKQQNDNPYGINIKHSVRLQYQVIFSSPNPNGIRWAGDPISALDFNSTTVFPSFKQRWNNSAHSHSGLFIQDAAPVHGTMKNTLTQSPDDPQAQVVIC